jgi:hypothetical protein
VTRLDDMKARHKAELREAVLEDELVKLKAKKGDGGARLRTVKNELRSVRQSTREARKAE